jgi:hypothetical protein
VSNSTHTVSELTSELACNLMDLELEVVTSRGESGTIALEDGLSVARVYHRLCATLEEIGIEVTSWIGRMMFLVSRSARTSQSAPGLVGFPGGCLSGRSKVGQLGH